MLALVLSLGCAAKIHALYAEHEAFALEDPGEVPSPWQAEAAVRLGEGLVSELIGAALEDALQGSEALDLGVGTVTPKLSVERLALSEDGGCAGCVGLGGRLKGRAVVEVAGMTTKVPLSLGLETSLKLRSKARKDGKQDLELRIVELRSLDVRLGDEDGFSFDLTGALEDWGKELVEAIPPLQLGRIGGDNFPVRELRVVQDGKAVRAEMITTAAHGGPLGELGEPPAKGFQVAISEAVLLDFARKRAFETGELALDVFAEPTSLELDGQDFTLGLRLWRLQDKRAWWRDYEISGTLELVDGSITLQPVDVAETGKSLGAGLVDPLATLAKGRILDSISEAATQALPGEKSLDGKRMSIQASVTKLKGVNDNLVLVGEAEVLRPTEARGGGKKGSEDSAEGGKKKTQGGKKKTQGGKKKTQGGKKKGDDGKKKTPDGEKQ
jgi:hypothetical protein